MLSTNEPDQTQAQQAQLTTQPTVNVKRRTVEAPKVSVALKRLWHAACFAPRDRKGSGRALKKQVGWLSLKAFAKQTKDELGKAWFATRSGK
jgi:hypothetical protein